MGLLDGQHRVCPFSAKVDGKIKIKPEDIANHFLTILEQGYMIRGLI